MQKEQAEKRINELCEKLNFHSYQYYVENNSDISDYEYDMLQRELLALETEYPERLPPLLQRSVLQVHPDAKARMTMQQSC